MLLQKRHIFFVGLSLMVVLMGFFSSVDSLQEKRYLDVCNQFHAELTQLKSLVEQDKHGVKVKLQILSCRRNLKKNDFWYRYLQPIWYKKLNAPLPIEWETEVFEKWEKPYKREGAGLTLLEIAIEENTAETEALIDPSIQALEAYQSDTIRKLIRQQHNFYFANRLFLLNLATIYTTGFECPEGRRVISELTEMMTATRDIYLTHNQSFPKHALPDDYISLYGSAQEFVRRGTQDIEDFDHYTFIRNFVNPLFARNQELIDSFNFISTSLNDFSLNNVARTIFQKDLYQG
ncbi:MAG: cytochrome C peroxidase, partial [Bacteroidia bacterium]